MLHFSNPMLTCNLATHRAAQAGHPWDGQQLLAFGEALLSWLAGVAQANAGQQVRGLCFGCMCSARTKHAVPVVCCLRSCSSAR